MVTKSWNIEPLFIFDIFSPGVDHLQLYQLLICVFQNIWFFFFHLNICSEKDAFRQNLDSVMVVLPWLHKFITLHNFLR